MTKTCRHAHKASGACTLVKCWPEHSGDVRCSRFSVPASPANIRQFSRTLKQRAFDVLPFFDHPGTSNGLTEAINGRLEHLRDSALGLRSLRNYIARSILEAEDSSTHLPIEPEEPLGACYALRGRGYTALLASATGT